MSGPRNEPLEIGTPEEDRLEKTHLGETHQEEDHREEIHHEEVYRPGGTQTTIDKGIESIPGKSAVTSTSSMEIEVKQRNFKWNLASPG